VKIEMIVTRVERVIIGAAYGYEVQCGPSGLNDQNVEIRTTERPDVAVDDEVTVTIEKGWES
jgi:hypothetical protein